MKIDNASIYAQNLAELNSAKTTRKENNESFDVILENETKKNGIKAEDIKTRSDLDEYLMDKAIKELGQEKGVGVWFFSVVASLQVALDKYGLDSNNSISTSIEKLMEDYKSTDDLKQDIINRISIIQSDRYDYTTSHKSKAEFEIQKQDTINALTQIYKELFNEEPIVPKYETVSNESSIDISAAIKEFLSKPYEKEEDVLKFIKDLDKQNQEEPSAEILGIKERIYKQNEKLKSENLNLLLQNI